MTAPVSEHYEVVYAPVEGSAHVYRGLDGERGGAMLAPEAQVASRVGAEAMAVGYGFARAGGWEFRYGAFWVAEVRPIMTTPG